MPSSDFWLLRALCMCMVHSKKQTKSAITTTEKFIHIFKIIIIAFILSNAELFSSFVFFKKHGTGSGYYRPGWLRT